MSTESLSIQSGEVQAVEHDIEPTKKVTVDRAVGDASVEDYDGLILPDGAVNLDKTGVDMSSVTEASWIES